jgi:hypothetical protein
VNAVKRLDTREWYYRELFGREEGLIGLVLVADPYSHQPFIDGMDRLVLVIRENVAAHEETEHWLRDDVRIQVRRVTPETVERWVVTGDRSGVQWLVQGEVLSDDTGYLEELRRRLDEWPEELRLQKLLCEFSLFIRTYLLAKQDLQNGQVLDAYSNVLASLQYWAHISLVEQGMHPELTVWGQMRRVNPGIYKLYEELTISSESLEKRVQLVLLACEFSVLTKMRSSCALLIQLLGSRDEPWTVAELQQDSRLRGLPVDLSLLLQKLVQRGLAREVARSVRGRGAVKLELRYTYGDE